jgi:choline dehydrogenase-like flavoprotein
MSENKIKPFEKRETVFALVKALFPLGEKVSAANPEEVEKVLFEMSGGNPLVYKILGFQISVFNFFCFLLYGKFFHDLTDKRQEEVIESWSKKAFLRLLLRVTALPYKLLYIHLQEVQQKLCIAQEKSNVAEPARWLQQISCVDEYEEDEELEADVVIVGTGAGGAAAAYEFASKGLAVVLVEEGRYYDRSHFTGKLFDVVPKLYRLEPTGTIGNHVIPVPIGKNVGGTTTINSGTAMRTPPETLKIWREEHGLEEFTEEYLDPYFSEVEKVICVQQADPKHVGQLGEIMRTGAEGMGFKDMGPLTRNAEGCDGQGLCQFGCPTDAKKSTNVSYIPLALDAGAFLMTGFKATKLLEDLYRPRESQGIEAVGVNADGKKIKLKIKAKKTIISMGTFYTPVFLKKNGVRNKWLGKNLSVHPAGVVTGLFPDNDFENTNKIPQGYGIKDWREKGLMFEGGTPPFLVHAVGSINYGKAFVEEVEHYQQTAYFGFMIKDKTRGKVFQPWFLKFPILWYWINKEDREQLFLGVKTLASFYLKAGAKEIYMTGNAGIPPIKSMEELEALFKKKRKIRELLLTAYHPLGTARLGVNKKQGVCDTDHKVFDWENLYVMDGSSVPSSLGANPQVTIMALASRAARKLAEELT